MNTDTGRSAHGELATSAALPFVTIVMPVRNEEHSIARSLGAVLRQDYPPARFEVMVVDGMSTDGTRAVVSDLAASARSAGPAPEVHIVDNVKQIVPTGLNAAIARSTADIIVRVDGHCEIASTYVRSCVRLLQETGADNVGGVAIAEGTGLVGRAAAAASSSRFGAGNAAWRYASEARWTHTVPFGCWYRETIERLGGFDEELIRNQDDEFNLRLCQSGGRIWLDPAIRTAYECRSTIRGLWRQYFGYGLYKVRVMQKRGVSSVTHLVPAAFVVASTASVLVGVASRRRGISFVVIGPYMCAVTAATLSVARKDPVAAIALPVVYPVLHGAYGLGSLVGLWRWRHFFREAASERARHTLP